MKTLIMTFLLCLSTQLLAANPLGAGDMLRITVYDNPDLTTETRVTSDDTINFPLIGEVSVAGKSVPEAERMIASELGKQGFLRNPQVNILVTEFLSQQVSILGNVTEPKRSRCIEKFRSLMLWRSRAGLPNWARIQSRSFLEAVAVPAKRNLT